MLCSAWLHCSISKVTQIIVIRCSLYSWGDCKSLSAINRHHLHHTRSWFLLVRRRQTIRRDKCAGNGYSECQSWLFTRLEYLSLTQIDIQEQEQYRKLTILADYCYHNLQGVFWYPWNFPYIVLLLCKYGTNFPHDEAESSCKYLTSSKKQAFQAHSDSSCLLLLSWQQTESLLQSDSLSGVLVIWRESGWVGRFGDLTISGGLSQSVDSLAVWANRVHQMHLGLYVFRFRDGHGLEIFSAVMRSSQVYGCPSSGSE